MAAIASLQSAYADVSDEEDQDSENVVGNVAADEETLHLKPLSVKTSSFSMEMVKAAPDVVTKACIVHLKSPALFGIAIAVGKFFVFSYKAVLP